MLLLLLLLMLSSPLQLEKMFDINVPLLVEACLSLLEVCIARKFRRRTGSCYLARQRRCLDFGSSLLKKFLFLDKFSATLYIDRRFGVLTL
jgi:hypothetical protein